jgi:hypothetical protein
LARDRKLYTLDCETDPFKVGRVPQPFLWGLYDGKQYEEFRTAAEVVHRLEREKATVYAHNGGKFDYHYLREYINTDENIMLIGGRLARFRIGECEFRDSMNLFTFALAAYQKEKIDYALMEPDMRSDPNNRAIISRYLRSDCVNLFELVTAFYETYGKHLTQAGAAMRVWSQMSGFKPPRQTVAQYDTHKPYYYGGRVECFQSGHMVRPFSVVDINSAYPDAMVKSHPISCDSELRSRLPDDSHIPRCFIKLDAISLGALPYIESQGSVRKLLFPNDGEIRTYEITGWEFIAALETNAITDIRIREVRYFHECIDFREYVERFFKLKREAKTRGDKAQELFAKIFLNALYGKFAANPLSYREYRLAHPENMEAYEEHGWSEAAQWGERILIDRELHESKQRYYNVATAASITGYVRAHLWRSLKACKGVLYCDTDSIAAEDISGLPLGDSLGQWKLEMQCSEYAIAGKKLYAYRKTQEWFDGEKAAAKDSEARQAIKEWKTAAKGTKLVASDIVKIAQGATVTFRPEVPTYSIHRADPVFINRNVRNTAVIQ